MNTTRLQPRRTRIAAGSDDLSARVWDARFGLQLWSDRGGRRCLDRAALRRRTIRCGGRVVSCRILEVASGEWVADGEVDGTSTVCDGARTGQRSRLATRPGWKLWRWDSGASVMLRHEGLRATAFGADGSYLVTAGSGKPRRGELGSGAGRIWRTLDGRLMTEVHHSDTAIAAAAHPDGVTFATAAGPDGGHDIVISHAGRRSDIWVEIGAPANALAFSPDGNMLAVGFHELGVGLFNTRTGRHLRDVGRSGEVRAVAFDPQGRLLAVTTNRESYQGPRVATTEVFLIEGDPNVGRNDEPQAVLSGESFLAFAEGSSFLATQDRSSVRMRDTESWDVACSFAGASAQAGFSFRNSLMAWLDKNASTDNLSVSRWTPDDLASELRRRLPRDLSEDEWREYIGTEPFRPLLNYPPMLQPPSQ